MRNIRNLFFILFILFCASLLSAEQFSGDDLDITLIIIGQGDPIYSYWGHTGLIVENHKTGRNLFYDFGNFSFEERDFIRNFVMGRLIYIAAAKASKSYLRYVITENRTITAYTLDISPEKKIEVAAALNQIVMPENRNYLYHHYEDNCSTRIRDYLDMAVDGQLEAASNFSADTTYRHSFLRFTSQNTAASWFLSFLQGADIDKPVTVWQAMYLPAVMEDFVSGFTYLNDEGEDIPFVLNKTIMSSSAGRSEIPAVYRPAYLKAIIFSLLFFIPVILLRLREIRKNRQSKLFGTINIIFGIIIGLSGAVLFFLMAFTDHTVSYRNFNIMLVNPIALLAVPAGIRYIRNTKGSRVFLEAVWGLQLLFALVMLIIKISPAVSQDNIIEIILLIPLLTALSPIGKAAAVKIPVLRSRL